MVSVRPGAGKRAQVDYLLNSQEFTHMIMLDADAALIRHQGQMWAIDIYIYSCFPSSFHELTNFKWHCIVLTCLAFWSVIIPAASMFQDFC